MQGRGHPWFLDCGPDPRFLQGGAGACDKWTIPDPLSQLVPPMALDGREATEATGAASQRAQVQALTCCHAGERFGTLGPRWPPALGS